MMVVRSQYPSAPNSSLVRFSYRVPSARTPLPSSIAMPEATEGLNTVEPLARVQLWSVGMGPEFATAHATAHYFRWARAHFRAAYGLALLQCRTDPAED
jgi:hypothetical protein